MKDHKVPWHRQAPDGIDFQLTDELNRRARWRRRWEALGEWGPLLPLLLTLFGLTCFGLGQLVGR